VRAGRLDHAACGPDCGKPAGVDVKRLTRTTRPKLISNL
jgi:hypothetical protein